jgi:glucosamine--fructose-6-phosphate aminotransferase (isomerizing)
MPGQLMAAEMAGQPEVLADLSSRRPEISDAIRSVMPDELAGIVLIARGSSDHAAIYGRYVLQLATGRPVALAAPSLHTLYDSPMRCPGYLAVAVSQSGRTPEIVTVVQSYLDAGATGIAITNDPSSPLSRASGATIDLGAGEERAVPATKTFTSQLAAFALLAETLGEVGWTDDDWKRLPEAVSEVLDDLEPARRVATKLVDAQGLISVGRGFMYSVALEAALKLKETTSLLAEGYSAADLRHGPVAVIEHDFPVLAFCVRGLAAADMQELIRWLISQREARVFVSSDEPASDLPLPPEISEALGPIPAAVRAQQVARELALLRGMDPDTPEGLTKVTPTT